MPRWSHEDGTCDIFTYKAGLLSAMGHDLQLRCERFTITYEDETLSGAFDATQITVLGAVKDGEVSPGVLSDKDKADILDNIRRYVFKQHQPSHITFACDDVEEDEDYLEGEGTLTIPPREHDVDFEVRIEEGVAVCEVRLHQPNWGIAPFSALMGALKIQPDVTVRITVPWTS